VRVLLALDDDDGFVRLGRREKLREPVGHSPYAVEGALAGAPSGGSRRALPELLLVERAGLRPGALALAADHLEQEDAGLVAVVVWNGVLVLRRVLGNLRRVLGAVRPDVIERQPESVENGARWAPGAAVQQHPAVLGLLDAEAGIGVLVSRAVPVRTGPVTRARAGQRGDDPRHRGGRRGRLRREGSPLHDALGGHDRRRFTQSGSLAYSDRSGHGWTRDRSSTPGAP